MQVIARVLAWIAALILWSIAPASADTMAGTVGRPLATCIAPYAASLSARTLMAQPGRFTCGIDQLRWGSGDYDVLSALLPAYDAADPIAVRVTSLWQNHVVLYTLYADGLIVRSGDDRLATSRHLQLGAIVEWRLPVRDAPVTRLLWRTRGSANIRGIVAGVTIATPEQSIRSNLIMAAIYAGFVGLCAALLIYNFALWCALRHRFQLAYCIMVATLLVYALSSSGALAWIIPGLDNNDRLRINYVALAFAAVAAMAFARSFFEPRVFAGWIGRVAHGVSALVITSAIAFAALAPFAARWLDRVYAVSFAWLVAVVIAALWRAWRLRSNYLWLFMLGWGTPITFATLRIASNFDLIDWSFWLDNSTILAMTAEAVLSSLAIAYRIYLLSLDRDDAREQEIAARLLAATDPLTGLLNRRSFLEQAIGREGEQMLLLADIDHFKHVNDTLGHDGGDEVLRVFARALRGAVPDDALVARIGGEEFAIIAPVRAALSATLVLEAVRAERMPFDLSVTASIGTCSGPLTRETDWKQLYRGADRALFEAKAAGRDRARDAGPLTYAA